jgi:hypothetical protein
MGGSEKAGIKREKRSKYKTKVQMCKRLAENYLGG